MVQPAPVQFLGRRGCQFPDFHPVWRGNSELVYVVSAATGLFATVTVTSQGGLTFGAPVTSPTTVTANRIATETRTYDIMPDGRFVGVVDAAAPDGAGAEYAAEIRVVLNWTEELKTRVPPAR